MIINDDKAEYEPQDEDAEYEQYRDDCTDKLHTAIDNLIIKPAFNGLFGHYYEGSYNVQKTIRHAISHLYNLLQKETQQQHPDVIDIGFKHGEMREVGWYDVQDKIKQDEK